MLLRRLVVALACLCKNALTVMEEWFVGGERVAIEKYPHSAYLAITSNASTDLSWACGASILNQDFMLTAAHCVIECENVGHIYVIVGHEHINEGVMSSAYKYKTHEEYESSTMNADIALVSLKTPFQFGPKVQRVILMRSPPPEKVAYVAGWGMVDKKNYISKRWLKHASKPLWSREDCVEAMETVPDGSLCAGSKSGNDLASVGDSGSALVIQGTIQVGIVSYKNKYWPQVFVVYVNVSHYYDWITRSTKNMYCG